MLSKQLFRFLQRLLPEPIKRLGRPLYVPLFQRAELYRLKKLYSLFIQPGDLVFDVGAHTGEMAAVLLHCGAKVICIEPQPRCVEILKKRFTPQPALVIVQKGVGSKEGVLPLAVCSTDTPLASFSQQWKKLHPQQLWDQQIDVQMTTLDKLIKQYGKPSFCKIDVEGFEYEVFCGLTMPLHYLSFEFHGAVLTDTEKCIAYLHQLGNAAFNYSLYSNHRLVLSSWTSGEEILQQLRKIHDPELCGDIYVKF